MQTIVTDTKNRKIVLTEDQLIEKWFRDNREELTRIAHKVSVVRNTPLFRGGFSKGLLALGTHLFAKMLIDAFPEVEDPELTEANKKTKFELFGKRFALALTSEEIGKGSVTLKSNYEDHYIPDQEKFADYILIVQLMDFDSDQYVRFTVLTYDTLQALPTTYTKKMNIELHTKHLNSDILLVDTSCPNPRDVDQHRANKMIENAFEQFLNHLAGIATEMIEE